MQVGDACLPEDLRQAVAYQLKRLDNKLMRVDILESLTTIRRQTAIDSKTGVADETTLRSARVVLRELEFTANLSFEVQPGRDALTLLSVGTLALRRLGSNRNRGLGHIEGQLLNPDDQNITKDFVQYFGTL
ncbi:conserved hypothetical protein [Kamptonema sp. PCC 6506]|nr:conserved hypothetical protein [Kamptonema sp. PCC 6506]